MPLGEHYAEQLNELRRHLAEPTPGLILLEFASIPQLESIVAGARAVDPARACVEVLFDPPQENAAAYLDRVRQEIAAVSADPLPLLVLRPSQLPDAAADHNPAVEFWRALNFRRETLGDLNAQVLLCVDPWHHDRLVDYAADLRHWTAPKFHLLPAGDEGAEPSTGLAAMTAFARLEISPEAADRRWQTFWPELEKARNEHQLEASHVRRLIMPLLEASLAQGNLVRARQVRDAAQGVRIPQEDTIAWHKLNVILACAAQDFATAEDHCRKLLGFAEGRNDDCNRRKAYGELWNSTGLLFSLGQAAKAEVFQRELCRLSEELNGANHAETLGCRSNLAASLQEQGRFAEAEKEDRAVLALRERLLGAEHPDTLASRSNLTRALREQGRYAEAEEEDRARIILEERILGSEHPDTLASRSNLAITLRAQGKNKEAELEDRERILIEERILGKDHPDTLRSRNHLAISLRYQGMYAEAEREHRAVLAERERVLGASHPEVFRTCFGLALCLQDQHSCEALTFARRAAEGWKRVLGEQHPSTRIATALVEKLKGKQQVVVA